MEMNKTRSKNRVANKMSEGVTLHIPEVNMPRAEAQSPRATLPEGSIMIRAGKMPGKIHDLALTENQTVQAALEAAKLNATGYEVRVNGEDCRMGDVLKEGDTVLLVRSIRGN